VAITLPVLQWSCSTAFEHDSRICDVLESALCFCRLSLTVGFGGAFSDSSRGTIFPVASVAGVLTEILDSGTGAGASADAGAGGDDWPSAFPAAGVTTGRPSPGGRCCTTSSLLTGALEISAAPAGVTVISSVADQYMGNTEDNGEVWVSMSMVSLCCTVVVVVVVVVALGTGEDGAAAEWTGTVSVDSRALGSLTPVPLDSGRVEVASDGGGSGGGGGGGSVSVAVERVLLVALLLLLFVSSLRARKASSRALKH
jgi:hypothetical protein